MTSEGAALWVGGWQLGLPSIHPPHLSKQHPGDAIPLLSDKVSEMKKTQIGRCTPTRNGRDSHFPSRFGNSKLRWNGAAPINHWIYFLSFLLSSFGQHKRCKEQMSMSSHTEFSPVESRFWCSCSQSSVETLQALPRSTFSQAPVNSPTLLLFRDTFF